MEQKATTTFLKLAEHYALTPIARTRLGLADLHAKSMQAELERQLEGDTPSEPPVDLPDADVVEDGDVGLPGV